MDKVWIMAKKELNTFFNSLLAYILLTLFLGLTGLFTWVLIWDIFSTGQASLKPFFWVCFVSFSIFIPVITMGMFSEEKRSGTIELLLTKSVSDWQVIFGKLLAVFILVLVALLITSPYYISVTFLGDKIDHGQILSGYLAVFLLSLSSISVGLWASSISNNQIISLLISLGVATVLHFFCWLLSFGPFVPGVFDYIAGESHFASMTNGVVAAKDIVYFLSIFLAGLFLTEAVLSKRRQA